MNLEKYLSVAPEIAEAVKAGKPVVALESTILSHGMPYPENWEFSHKVEEIIRGEGAIPATTAIIGGKLKVGLTADELELMCKDSTVGKVSRRDVAVYLATGKTGATTVATTMMLAEMAGIRVFATGGIGGVHRGAESTFDISADLQELANTGVAVVCAGAKSLLDIPKTLEYLETMGVPVLGMDTNDFPAFYCRKSGCKVDCKVNVKEAAAIHVPHALSSPTPSRRNTSWTTMRWRRLLTAPWRPPRRRASTARRPPPSCWPTSRTTPRECPWPPTSSWPTTTPGWQPKSPLHTAS